MGTVFISYARVDVAFVRQLCALLANQDRDPWVDWEGIPPSAEWLAEVYAAIEAADAFLFVISPDSCASPICRLEVEHATQNHKRLVPILYRDVPADDVPASLAKVNWILFRDGEDPERAASLLADALDTDLDWLHAHTRLLMRSLEWEREARDDSLLLRGEDLRRALAWFTQAHEQRKPAPTFLQSEYVRVSQEAEEHELERVRALYERALAGKLAAQSRWLQAARLGALPLAMALAVESIKRWPSPEAEEALRGCIPLQPKRVVRFDHDHPVAVIAFSPQGDLLVTASGRLTEREWYELEALEKSYPEDFVDERDWQQFRERGTKIRDEVSGNVAYLWDSLTGGQLARFEHRRSVMAVAFSANGKRLATGSTDGTAKIWEIPSGEMISCMDLASRLWRGTLALNDDGSLLVAQEKDHEVTAWDVNNGRKAAGRSLAKATNALTHAEHDRREQERARVTSSLRDADLAKLEDGATQLGIRVRSDSTEGDLIEAIADEVLRRAFAVSPDGLLFADAHRFSSDSVALSVHDIFGSELARLAPGGFVEATAFHPSSRYVCTATRGQVELWSLEAERTLRFLRWDTTNVGLLVFTRDGKYLVTAEDSFFDIPPRVAVWDVAAEQRVDGPLNDELRSLLSAATDPWNLTSPYSGLVAMWHDPGRVVRVRDGDSRRILNELEHEGWIRCAAFGPNDLLVTGTDLAAHVWNARSGAELVCLEHAQQVRSVAFDASGERIATACDDNSARVWDLVGGRQVLAVDHDSCVGAVAFSPDGNYLATGSDDNTARLWSIATQTEVARLLHKDPVRAVRFSPDGRTLATGSLSGEVGLWVARPDTLTDLACRRLARNLTPEEWRQYLPDEPYRATCPGADG